MWAVIIVIVVVVAIIAFGIGLFVRSMSKTHWLKQHGTRIIARVTDSVFAAGIGSTKVIIAEWTDPRTNTTYKFRSFVPTAARVKVGESVGRQPLKPSCWFPALIRLLVKASSPMTDLLV